MYFALRQALANLKKYNNFINSLVLSIVVYIMYTVDINESEEKLNAIKFGCNSWK